LVRRGFDILSKALASETPQRHVAAENATTVKYFFSTGEPSGEAVAIFLAEEIRKIDPRAAFEGIGGAKMREAGFELWRNSAGWASLGPLAAIPKIPKLLNAMLWTAFHIRATKPDLVVMVDFGVFNLRLANTLRRRLHYTGPIMDVFPPSTWLDNPDKARNVSAVAVPVTAFEHQYNFYRGLDLRVEFFGHPLASRYRMRPMRAVPPSDGGTIAMLPGSRSGELRRHLPVMAATLRTLQQRRPRLRAVFGAADDRAERMIRETILAEKLRDAEVVRGVEKAVAQADAALVVSGTAVLETALLGVPSVAIYVIPRILIWYGRRMIRHRYITPPNLVLEREVVPELLQERATPQALADAVEEAVSDPQRQYAEFVRLREALGPSDALQRIARCAVELARSAA
jgi:lipid-A-disaccharide synthase